jgi:KUP system potassium uptake protein
MSSPALPSDSVASKASLKTLLLGTIGVVYGDIGTSPLYAVKESIGGHQRLPIDEPHVLGVLSLIFWALLLVVTFKYVILMMRADNHGEGGSLSLLAMLDERTKNPRLHAVIVVMGLTATGLFYGDCVITPAISVLSAVEGIQLVAPGMGGWITYITLFILVGLFLLQSRGTEIIGKLFGPVMVVWFVVIGALGILQIMDNPVVLNAMNPLHALVFLKIEGKIAFLTLASVVLAVTGAEALYADMGHFGRRPIRIAWYTFVWPALILNYFGQGALLLMNPSAIHSPLYGMVSTEWRLPLIILATMATIIASQAVITGAFSVTRQAILLGYLPRMRIIHTSRTELGQIYMPTVNMLMLLAVAVLVLGFGSSTNLASAYGIAVTGTMVLTTMMTILLMRLKWQWSWARVVPFIVIFSIVDITLFAATTVKIIHGGWFPLLMGALLFIVLTTWKTGRINLQETVENEGITAVEFIQQNQHLPRVPGVAIYMSRPTQGVPLAMYQNVKHNHILHEKNIILSVVSTNVPFVSAEKQLDLLPRDENLVRIILRKGFMQDSDVPEALKRLPDSVLGFHLDPQTASYFVSRIHVQPTEGHQNRQPMSMWRKYLFAWMVHRATTAREFFNLPHNRVIELGTVTEF